MRDKEVIRPLSFFRQLDDSELDVVLSRCREATFGDGECILEEGVRGEGLYILRSGAVRVLKGIRGRASQRVARLREGEHFGEMSLVTDDPTAATVRAEGDAACVHLPKDAFLAILEAHPNIARKVLWEFVRSLSRRLAATDLSLARALYLRERRDARRHVLGLLRLQTRMFFSYFWALFRRKILRWPLKPEAMSRLHRKNARRFRETAFRLKGANVKIGQMASMQAHLLPREYIEEFKSMRDSVTPTEYPMIASLIQSEFGVGPLELFDEFDKIPIAAASMGQVHVARLKTGEKVVVKVQHPGLERSVEVDLSLMRFVFNLLAKVFRKSGLKQLLTELEEPLRREVDLHHEGKATEALAGELEPLGVVVPKIHWRYSTRRVLTMDFIDGVNVDRVEQLKEWGIDRQALMTTYVTAFLRQAFEGGFFHADPHPGNVFCTRDGRLALLDFGMVKKLPDHVRRGLMKELLGGFFNNPKLYVDGIIEKGALGEEDRGRLEEFAARAFSDEALRSVIFDHDPKAKGDVRRLWDETVEIIKACKSFRMPQDNLMFMRAIGIVVDVCKEVLPEVPPSQLAGPALMPVFATLLAEHPEYVVAPAAPTDDRSA